MNHEMNNQAIEGSRPFSTMVSNKVPATARCLSDGIHEDGESKREREWGVIERGSFCIEITSCVWILKKLLEESIPSQK